MLHDQNKKNGIISPITSYLVFGNALDVQSVADKIGNFEDLQLKLPVMAGIFELPFDNTDNQ